MAINIYFFQTNIIIIHHSWCSPNGLDFDIVRLCFAMLHMTFVYTIRKGAFLKLLEESDSDKKCFCPLGLKTNVFHGSRHPKIPSPLGIFFYIDVAPKSMTMIQRHGLWCNVCQDGNVVITSEYIIKLYMRHNAMVSTKPRKQCKSWER